MAVITGDNIKRVFSFRNVGGQNRLTAVTATIVSSRYWDMHIPLISHLPDAFRCFVLTSTFIMHADTHFHSHTVVTLSAESVGGSTPGVRVTWNTTVPPECVASVTVEFRISSHWTCSSNQHNY